jgi:hypothetical protein
MDRDSSVGVVTGWMVWGSNYVGNYITLIEKETTRCRGGKRMYGDKRKQMMQR